MKVCIHQSQKVMETWPVAYCDELIDKLLKRGDRAFLVTDDLPDDKARETIAMCDYFVGPPTKYTQMAKDAGVKTVDLLGPMLKGDGIKSPIICAGCLDKIDPKPVDCFFADEICFYEISPNDVLEALCV